MSNAGAATTAGLTGTFLPLGLATFAVGTDAFVMAGLLPAIAADLGVGIAVAGQLVTVFAVTLAVAAPVLSWLLTSLDRRRALHIALVVFVLGNAATALSPTYPLALAARILTALGAATITSTASSAAMAIAPEHHRGRALALVTGGLTLSTALGMPLGSLIGQTDWRITLWAVAGLGVIAALGAWVTLPRVRVPAVSLTARLAPLRRGRVLSTLGATLLVMAGHYTLYTYIGPVTATATAGSIPQALTLILLAWGVGVLAGNFLAGLLADRRPGTPVALFALIGGALLLGTSPLAVTALPTALVWAACWGATDGMVSVVQQHRLVALAPASAPLLFGLNSSAIYVGVAIGGLLGGLSETWLPAPLLGLPAATLALLAVLVTLGDARRARRSSGTAVADAVRA